MVNNVDYNKKNLIENFKREILNTKKEYEEMGGWKVFKSGDWFLDIFKRTINLYFEKVNSEYFKSKYPDKDNRYIINKITSVASRNAALLGFAVGLTMSADEIIGFLTDAEIPFEIPINIGIALASLASEAIILVKMQLKLVIEIAKLYDVPLDINDPEDIEIIMAYALGGATANEAGKFGMKIGGHLAEKTIKKVIKKDVLKTVEKIGQKIGVKILQGTIIKYAVPLASMAIGTSWNYLIMKSISKVASTHFKKRREQSDKKKNKLKATNNSREKVSSIDSKLLNRLYEQKSKKQKLLQ